MAKRELRLAVVIYGGASLAVYMHGVTKELLKLVRASKVLHEIGPDAAADLAYADGPDQRPHDTEAVYFELLKAMNRRGKFRVTIDVIAGASAGAINGLMLAKALLDDSTLDALTDTWLIRADSDQLSSERHSRWRKWYLFPLLKLLGWWLPDTLRDDMEIRDKLNRFVRQSWFQPPFSGAVLCRYFFEAFDTMKRSRRPGSTLLPHDMRLDVYASVTDLFGYGRDVELHRSHVARENEHGLFCRLTHVQSEVGREQSDFSDHNIPALVWAARASSSYAGAFPSFRHAELQAVLRDREQSWPGESRFLAQSLFASDGTPANSFFDPRTRVYVDGGIVNNKPFEAVLEALKHRSADRQVRRLIAYIEPDPKVDPDVPGDRAMSYLNTIRAAATTIPRNQPVLDDLKEFVLQDKRAQTNRRLIDDNAEQILALVGELWLGSERPPASLEALRRAKHAMLGSAEREMGLAYRAYVQRRAWRLIDALASEWMLLTPELDSPEVHRGMMQSLEHWWGVTGDGATTGRLSALDSHNRKEEFLQRFDVSFRIRRVQFVIRRLNTHDVEGELDTLSQASLAEFKVAAYAYLERLYVLRRARGIDAELAMALIEAARQVPLTRDAAVDLLERLAAGLDLHRHDAEFDGVFYHFCQGVSAADLRQRIAAEYVGFPIYDSLLITRSGNEGEPDPLTPVRVSRISPPDSGALEDVFDGLKCRRFMGFLGFFNRGYREHDYLWGRLNGADRIVDFLLDAAAEEFEAAGVDVDAMRHRLFDAILQRERSRLHECADTLTRVGEHLRRSEKADRAQPP